MVIGTVNMDMSDLPVCSFTAGSGSRTGVNSNIVCGPWVRSSDESVDFTVDGCDVAYDSTVSTVDGGDVGLKAGGCSSLLPDWFSASNCSYPHYPVLF